MIGLCYSLTRSAVAADATSRLTPLTLCLSIQNTCVHLCIRAFVGACVRSAFRVQRQSYGCAILLTHVFLRKSACTSVHFDQAFSSDENQGYVNFFSTDWLSRMYQF